MIVRDQQDTGITRIDSNHPLSLRPLLTSNLLKRRQNRHISADFTIETCSNGLFLLSLQQFWTIMQRKMETTMIGREKEKQYLEDYLDSGKSE